MAIYQGSKKLAYSCNVDNSVYAVPIGTILSYSVAIPPVGFLVCDGSEVSKTTYADLFEIIGDTYGTATDTSKFKLPDLRDRFVQGANGNLGTSKDAGLPNITGKFYHDTNAKAGLSGAFTYEGTGRQNLANDTPANSGLITFDASKSNSIYGNSNTVQPPSVCLTFIIKALKVSDKYAEEVGVTIDDSSTSADKTWSSQKINTAVDNLQSSISTSQGRNLIPYPLTNRTTNGITYTVQSDGSVLANGTASAENNAYYNFAYKTLKLGDTSYTLSCEGLPKSVYVYVYDETIGKAIANVSNTPVTKTFVGDSTHTYSLSINVGKGTPVSDLAIKPILEMGTIAHVYEPISESNVNLKDAIDKISTSQGRNLISYPYYNGTSFESNGVTYTVNEVDGTITVNGTATKESDFRLVSPYDTSDRKTLELGQTYTLSDGVNQSNSIGYQAPIYFQFVRIDATKNDFNYGISTNYGNMTWTASDANLLQYGIRIVVRSGVTVDNVVLKPMLEIGAIAHSYEPTTENNISLKKSIETKATINDTSKTSTTETWSAKKINEKTAQNFDKRIILSVGRGTSGEYTDTANLNSAYGAYLYWASTAGQDQYSVGVILYVNKGWMIIPIKETDGGTNITFSINGSILTMTKSSSNLPSAGGVIALGSSI